MVDGMYWGICEQCPHGKRYKYIPEGSPICRDCMNEAMQKVQASAQSHQITQEELAELQKKD